MKPPRNVTPISKLALKNAAVVTDTDIRRASDLWRKYAPARYARLLDAREETR